MRSLFGFRKRHVAGPLRLLGPALFAGAFFLAASVGSSAQDGNAQQRIADEEWTLPAPVEELLYARRFSLSEGYQWGWPPDAPPTKTGVIVVLRVDPRLVVPRESLSPILYAGDRMLQTLNFGHMSGNVIGIVPGEADLLETPFWFGSPKVPALVNEQSIRADRALAEEAGIRPFPVRTVEAVTKSSLDAPDLAFLLRGELADLVLEYAPEERNLARKWRLPEAMAVPDGSRPSGVRP